VGAFATTAVNQNPGEALPLLDLRSNTLNVHNINNMNYREDDDDTQKSNYEIQPKVVGSATTANRRSNNEIQSQAVASANTAHRRSNDRNSQKTLSFCEPRMTQSSINRNIDNISFPRKRQHQEDELVGHKRQKINDDDGESKNKTKALNFPRSFDDGKSCCRCNNLAAYFNKKGVKISLPIQHRYGGCPLYCNICTDRYRCQEPEEHLIYSCSKCDATYCNHPTDKCPRK
jgi:hypothetical protein